MAEISSLLNRRELAGFPGQKNIESSFSMSISPSWRDDPPQWIPLFDP
jgi:hypothetical protein